MVKITVDTKEDSHEEIKKVIKMLTALVDDRPYSNQGNIFEDASPSIGESETPSEPTGSVFGNIFGEIPKPEDEDTSISSTETATSEEEKDDIPPVMEY